LKYNEHPVEVSTHRGWSLVREETVWR